MSPTETTGWQGVAEAVSSMVLVSLWQCLVVALLYALLRRVVGSPRWRMLLGYLALVACATMALVQLFSALGDQATALPTKVWHASSVSVLAQDELVGNGDGFPWRSLLALFWFTGVFLQSGRFAHQWWLMRRLLRDAIPVVDELQRTVAALAQRMGMRSKVRVFISNGASSLLTVGWLRPVILIPASAVTGIPAAHLDLLILHEIAHIRRADWVLNLVQVLIETILFFHPALHWISAMVRHDRELCCDDLVTRQAVPRLSYARALLSLAELESSAPVVRNRLAMAAGDGVLMNRIGRIVGHPTPRSYARYVILKPMALLLLGVTGLIGLAQWRLEERAVTAWVTHMNNVRAILGPLPSSWNRVAQDWASDLTMRDEVADLPIQIEIPAPPVTDRAVAALWSGPERLSAIPVAFGFAARGMEVKDLRVARINRQSEDVTDWSGDGLQPLRSPQPRYPLIARRDSSEGFVQLRFRVGLTGRVEDIDVVAQGGRPVFVDAAREALMKWRFSPQDVESSWQQVRFDFSLSDVTPERNPDRDCHRVLGSAICRPTP